MLLGWLDLPKTGGLCASIITRREGGAAADRVGEYVIIALGGFNVYSRATPLFITVMRRNIQLLVNLLDHGAGLNDQILLSLLRLENIVLSWLGRYGLLVGLVFGLAEVLVLGSIEGLVLGHLINNLLMTFSAALHF